MQLNARGHCLCISRQLHFPTLPVPVGTAEDMCERSSGSSLQRTQSAPTWNALSVRTSCQTPPMAREALKAQRKLSSVRLALFFRCR
eukprot:6090273-Amphidinium_carterae.1